MTQPQTPPGWYQADGDPAGTQRYWDGTQWVGGPQVVAAAPAVPAAPYASPTTGGYPIRVEIDPAATQSRLTVFFRILMVIPHLIVLALIVIALEMVTIIAWFAILIIGRFPAGMYNFSYGVQRWALRVNGYLRLLTGVYPPFTMDPVDSYPIRLRIDPKLDGRNRLTTFFRIFMIIPHAIVLYLLNIAVQVVMLIAWIVALFSGSVPAGLHTFMGGYTRWSSRVGAYALLMTDEYPPFSLE